MKNGNGGKRTNGSRAAELPPEVLAAPFAGIAIEPIDAAMWPIHPPGWFQPEAPASAPCWSSLAIERRHRIPAPDLVYFPLAPFDRTAACESRSGVVPSALRPSVPAGGLEPLGWDPRAFRPMKEQK
jgi:hypothetical protein